jgi:hypothetical protein
MAESEPIAEQLSSPSGAPLTALTWADVRTRLSDSEDCLLATSGAGGRVHMVPVLGVWLEGAVCFSTGRQTRKARDLAENDNCAITSHIRPRPPGGAGTESDTSPGWRSEWARWWSRGCRASGPALRPAAGQAWKDPDLGRWCGWRWLPVPLGAITAIRSVRCWHHIGRRSPEGCGMVRGTRLQKVVGWLSARVPTVVPNGAGDTP